MCLWTDAHGLRCNEFFYGNNLSAHMQNVHNIHGPDNLRLNCLWKDCGIPLDKEYLSRHIEEKHLGIGHPCSACGKTYSRKDTLSKHKKNCSGSSM